MFVREDDEGKLSDAQVATKIDEVNLPRASTDRIASLERELRYSKENLQAPSRNSKPATKNCRRPMRNSSPRTRNCSRRTKNCTRSTKSCTRSTRSIRKKITDLTELTADMDSLMASTDVATVFLDRELKIRKFTPQIVPIFRLIPHDVGRSIGSFAYHMDRPGLVADLQRVLDTGEILETDIQNRNGCWMYMRILPYRPNANSKVEGVVLTLTDIDKLKLTQEKLSSAVEDRERFLAMLSHEMRNPINAILSASHLLEAGQAEAPLLTEAVSVIRRQSGHLARLLDDLLDVSRMTQSKLELRKESMDLSDAIHDAIESMRPVINRKRQELHVQMLDIPLPMHSFWTNSCGC